MYEVIFLKSSNKRTFFHWVGSSFEIGVFGNFASIVGGSYSRVAFNRVHVYSSIIVKPDLGSVEEMSSFTALHYQVIMEFMSYSFVKTALLRFRHFLLNLN